MGLGLEGGEEVQAQVVHSNWLWISPGCLHRGDYQSLVNFSCPLFLSGVPGNTNKKPRCPGTPSFALIYKLSQISDIMFPHSYFQTIQEIKRFGGLLYNIIAFFFIFSSKMTALVLDVFRIISSE